MVGKMTNRREPQPHLFGAFPYQYRIGASIVSAEQPLSWNPESIHDHVYPYTLREYRRDVSRWQSAAKVTVQRQGPLVALAIGGAARAIADQIDGQALRDGVVADFHDGRGNLDHSEVELVFRVLEQHFPPDEEAQMLRAGLDFFGFIPRAQELTESLFLRYGSTLDRASRDAELGISFPFRSWMLLSLLQLPPKTWSEYLRDMNHRFLRNQIEYEPLKRRILRERSLEGTTGKLRAGTGHGNSSRNAYATIEEAPAGPFITVQRNRNRCTWLSHIWRGNTEAETFPQQPETPT